MAVLQAEHAAGSSHPHRGRVKERGPGRAGFTLLEMLIAIGVMAIGLSSAAIAMQVGLRNLDLARTTTQVAQILQDQSEATRLLNWTALSSLPAEQALELPEHFDPERAETIQLQLTRRVESLPGLEDLKHITLEAEWRGIHGSPHTRSIHLRYARNGVFDYYYGTGS